MAASVWTLCKNLLLSDAVFLSQRILNISAFFLDKSKTFLDPFGIAYFNFWQRSLHRTKLQYEPTTVVELVKRSCGIAMGNSNWSAFSGEKIMTGLFFITVRYDSFSRQRKILLQKTTHCGWLVVYCFCCVFAHSIELSILAGKEIIFHSKVPEPKLSSDKQVLCDPNIFITKSASYP